MAPNQILKAAFPSVRFYEFLGKCCNVVGGYYVFNMDSYRKGRFHEHISDLRTGLLEYYYASKRIYLTRELKYSRFVTILRHICHHSNIPFTTRIHYANNTYYITYYIKCVADASVNSADNVTNGGATRDASQETTV